jgi:hypothetical protein
VVLTKRSVKTLCGCEWGFWCGALLQWPRYFFLVLPATGGPQGAGGIAGVSSSSRGGPKARGLKRAHDRSFFLMSFVHCWCSCTGNPRKKGDSLWAHALSKTLRSLSGQNRSATRWAISSDPSGVALEEAQPLFVGLFSPLQHHLDGGADGQQHLLPPGTADVSPLEAVWVEVGVEPRPKDANGTVLSWRALPQVLLPAFARHATNFVEFVGAGRQRAVILGHFHCGGGRRPRAARGRAARPLCRRKSP